MIDPSSEVEIVKREYVIAGIISIAIIIAGVSIAILWRPTGVKRIRFLCSEAGDPPTLQYMTERIAEFNEENPDIEIIPEFIGWSEVYAKITAGIEAGSPPELVFLDYPSLVYDFGWAEPVTDVLLEIASEEDWVPATRLIGEDGEDYIVPVNAELMFLYYRTDWFDEKNISYPMKSWDELLDAAKKLTEPDKGRYGIAISLLREYKAAEDFWCFLQQTGHVFDTDGETVVIDTPEVREALEFYKELANYTAPEAVEWGWGGVRNAFKIGKCAMHFYQGRTAKEIYEDYPELIPVVRGQPYPTKDPNDFPEKSGTFGCSEGFAVIKNSPYIEEAKKFIKFYVGTAEDYIDHLQTVPSHELPCRYSILDDPDFWDHPIYDAMPWLVPLIEDIVPKQQPARVEYLELFPDPSYSIAKTDRVVSSLAFTDALQALIVNDELIDDVMSTLVVELQGME